MKDDFLWHEVSEEEKERIKKQSKNIMDSFSKKLFNVGELKESFIERLGDEREEGKKIDLEMDREIIFKNAPNKNKDFIIAERKTW